MKRWGLHRIFNICLFVFVAGGIATVAWATTKTGGLSPEPGGQLDTQEPNLLGQADQVLDLGSTGDAVKDLQAMLALMGYYSGAVDGAYEQTTLAAVRQFQTDAGLVADGVVGPLTWRRLLPTPAALSDMQVLSDGAGSALSEGSPTEATSGDDVPDNGAMAQTAGDLPTLKLDDAGAEVSRLQSRLAALNFYTGPIDGVFGLQTEQAVQEFQRQAGLEMDGIVGPETWLKVLQ